MEKIYDTIPIKVWIQESEGTYVGKIEDDNYPQFSGCIVQADTKEDVLKELQTSAKCMISFYERGLHNYWKKAIFRGNHNGNQLWFTIIGIGMIFYWRNKDFTKKFPLIKPKYQFHIGRLWFSFKNEWKIKRK